MMIMLINYLKFIKKTIFLSFFLTFCCTVVHAKLVVYEFDIDQTIVNFTGEDVTALSIQGQIPGPTIEATVGDILRVTFHNKMDEETSIHWHGVILPNDQDGVPYLTTPPIKPHTSFTYEYQITHSGTYWYHSHTGLQEQEGIYGSLVFHPKGGELIEVDDDIVLVLSDWTNENANQVLANLKKDGDYYALKKGTVLSWLGVFQNGKEAIKNRLRGAFSRMGTMDLSDVGYDAFLINGKKSSDIKMMPHKKMRLRLINAAASSYFNVEFSGGPMKIVAADGVDIEPIEVKRLRIAIAETYDVIIEVPDEHAYELRATSQDVTGYGSVFIGTGEKIFAPDIPKPNLYLMNFMMHEGMKNEMSTDHSMHQAQEGVIPYMNDYKALKSPDKTNFPESLPRREVQLNLTGNMERYVWSFNHKTLTEADKVLIKKGEIVRFILKNETMMNHPIHLHGHFFRVLNGQGDRSPLKHTVNVPPMETVVIEFDANEEKDWFFHCHNLYHMKAGMARVISYEGSTTATKETIEKLAKDSWYVSNDHAVYTNMTMGIAKQFYIYDIF